MKGSSLQLLLAEYERRKALEQFQLENYERALQNYLTVITAAVGGLIILLERQVVASTFRVSVGLLFGAVLLIGEVTFLRMLGIDNALIESAKAYLLIRSKFLQVDPELADAFLEGLVQDVNRYQSWASIKGIICRALTVSQQKTTVVFLNSLACAGVLVILIWPKTIWSGVAVSVFVISLVGLLHVIYASWRYKQAARLLSAGEIRFWA